MKINNHPGRLTHFVITLFAALVLQTLCCTPPARAQQLFPGSAIAGREFYVSYLDNNDGATLQLKIVVEKACRITAKYNNLTDSCWNGWNNMLVQPGIYTDSVPYYDMINSQVTEKSSRTITVTSTEDICVYAINYYSARTDASTVLPVPTWGTEYYLATGIPTSSSRGSAYSVTAKEDGTVVTLHNGTTQSLNKNEVYHFYGGGADLTGGKVTATKPVAVFSGSGSSYGPGQGGHYCGNMGNASADHCYEQLWSVDKWGRDFFVWPVKTPQGYGNWGGIMVIVAQEAGTRVTVSGGINGGTDLEYNLNAEGYRYVCYEMSGLTKVTSNKSIMVFTILPDAAITWIPPVQQRIPRAVLSPFILSGNTHITHHAVEMLIPKDWWSQTVIKENGVTVPGNSGYDVTASAYFPDWITVRRELDNTDITIDVTCPGGMLAYMYGYGSAETYGYLAGAAAYDLQCYFTVREKATGLDAYYKNTSAVTHTFEMADNIIVNRAVEKAFTSITWLINGDPYTTVTDNNNMMNTLTFPAAALQGGENTLTMSVRFQDATQDSLYTAHLWLDKLKAFDDYATTAAGMSVKINVRTNDYLPAGCTTPVISVVAPLARHGMATSAGDSVRYVPNSGFTGSDTVTYTISCNGETATAKVYVYVAEMPDNISDAECYVTPPEMDWGMVEDWSSAATSISDHVVPLVGDMNGDGIPEIVVFTTTGRSANGPVSGYARPTLRTIAIYDTRTHLPVRTITIESAVSEYELDTYGMINTPDKGTLIVVPTIDLKLRAYNYAGATAWTSDSPYGQAGEHGAAVGFADFNHDGTPEIYINNRIFNASTGVMLAEAAGGSNRGAAYSCWSTQTSSTPPPAPNWKQSASTAADVLGTGDLQLILGNEIYELEINNPNGFSGNTLTLARTVSPPPGVIDDGHTQVADFNRDGFLDVFISNKTTAVAGYVHGYVWDVHNNTVSSPLVIPAGNNVNGGKSLPLVADFDNDSIPDVLVQTELYGTNKAVFRAFKYNPSSWSFTWMWDFPPVEDSHSTSATLFDFNLDGISEIVLQDQERLRIVNAATGVQHTEFTFGAGTVMQYPIVVDPYGVSGDRSARIVSIGRSGSTGSNLYEGSLNVLKAKSGHWAFARPVWNQIMYNSVNVNDDVSAARYPVNPAVFFPGQDETLNTADDVQPYNAFLKQTEILNKNGTPLWLAPDAAIAAATSAFHYHAGGDSLTVTVEVTNAGDAGLLAPFYLSAYKNTVAAGNKIATDSSLTALNPGAIQSVTLTIDSLSKFLPLDEIIIRVNDRGQATYVQPECDTTSNNAFTVSDLLLAHSDYVSTVSGMTVKIGIKANDSIPNGCAPTPEMLTPLTTPHGSAALMPDDSLRYTATAPGYDTLAYRLTCDGNTSTAYIYIYVAEKPNNITDVECYVPAPSTTWDIERKMVSNAEIHSLATPFAGDLDGDGRIEVVVPNNIGYSPTAQSMLIFDDSLRLIKTITPPATMPEYNTMTNLIADVDGDGKGEIVVATINRT
ncbi:MAG: hypothetical protein LBL07_11440, partial [Tannerella sp.]|nr:hypothetical protein [Tannerella sp.]